MVIIETDDVTILTGEYFVETSSYIYKIERHAGRVYNKKSSNECQAKRFCN